MPCSRISKTVWHEINQINLKVLLNMNKLSSLLNKTFLMVTFSMENYVKYFSHMYLFNLQSLLMNLSSGKPLSWKPWTKALCENKVNIRGKVCNTKIPIFLGPSNLNITHLCLKNKLLVKNVSTNQPLHIHELVIVKNA